MGLFEHDDEAKSTKRWDEQRVALEEKLLDAANELAHFMGSAAVKLASRVDNGQLLVAGTRDGILRMLDMEVVGTVDRPCSPAWFARLECRPETMLTKGETLYRKKADENQS